MEVIEKRSVVRILKFSTPHFDLLVLWHAWAQAVANGVAQGVANGLSKVFLGPAMLYPYTPCGWATP
jgi:hypothetical protein